MFDELEHLRESPALVQLLTHYAQLGAEDRQIWQDRLMQMEGVDAKALTQLHGELIAWEWIEQNTGFVENAVPGVVAKCYRITAAGVRALKIAQAGPELDIEAEMAAAEKKARASAIDGDPAQRKARRRVEKRAEEPEPVASEIEASTPASAFLRALAISPSELPPCPN